ncbi:MAG: dephospho-CoA kinase [Eubacteriales bacterium]|nr:dephospho-CoA kinase [Eubacteriales bacterium]
MTRNKPYIIGLTGGIACGKSNLTSALISCGAVVIDADEISRAITAAGGLALPGIRAAFGDGVFWGEELDRRKLAGLVFFDPSALKTLNAITHPLIFQEMHRQADQHVDQPALVFDVPLLFETGADKCCDEVWCAYAAREIQLERLLQRGLSEEEAIRRIDSQMSTKEKAQRSDHVIHTTGTKEESAAQAIALWDSVLRRLALV